MGALSVRLSVKILVILQLLSTSKDFAKIVLINLLGGATIPYAAYAAF